MVEYNITTYVFTTPYLNRYPFMIRWAAQRESWNYGGNYDEIRDYFDKIIYEFCEPQFGDSLIDDHFDVDRRLVIHFDDNRDFMLAKLRFG